MPYNKNNQIDKKNLIQQFNKIYLHHALLILFVIGTLLIVGGLYLRGYIIGLMLTTVGVSLITSGSIKIYEKIYMLPQIINLDYAARIAVNQANYVI